MQICSLKGMPSNTYQFNTHLFISSSHATSNGKILRTEQGNGDCEQRKYSGDGRKGERQGQRMFKQAGKSKRL